MSSLLKFLKRPRFWLAVALGVYALAALDTCRAPQRQVTARLYIGAVHAYQRTGRPVLARWVSCRYRPTCSEYSVAAVERHGILRGLVLTARRINSCTRDVPIGTIDQVP